MKQHEVIIKDSHRGLWYEDGVLKDVVGAGRYKIPLNINFGFWRRPGVEIVLIDVRQRELTIRGQEILTSDKVAIRVSIIVQFQVVDPKAAIHTVYSGAARRDRQRFNPQRLLDLWRQYRDGN